MGCRRTGPPTPDKQSQTCKFCFHRHRLWNLLVQNVRLVRILRPYICTYICTRTVYMHYAAGAEFLEDLPLTAPSRCHQWAQGCYLETGFHIVMDRNFICLWRRHNCRSQVIDLYLSALISWFMKSIIGFLNNWNLHAIISITVIINFHWVQKNYFAVLEEIFNNVGQQF